MLLSPLGERLGEGVLQEVAFALTPSPNLSPQGGEEHEYDAGLEARGPARLAPGNPEIGDGRADKDLRLRGWPDAHAPLETLDARTRRRGQLAPGRGAVELLQQALVIIGVLIDAAAAVSTTRLGWRIAGVRKTPLWQADTITTVGRRPHPASRALPKLDGWTVPLAARRTTPLSSP